MNYKVGDKVRIKSLDWYNKNKDKTNEIECGSMHFIPDMTVFCNKNSDNFIYMVYCSRSLSYKRR